MEKDIRQQFTLCILCFVFTHSDSISNGSVSSSTTGAETLERISRTENYSSSQEKTEETGKPIAVDSINIVQLLFNRETKLLISHLLTESNKEGWTLFNDSTPKSPCYRDADRLVSSTLSGVDWTLPFVDSSAKPGISMSLSWLWLVGNYDQCRSSVAPPTNNTPGFKGQYCVLKFYSGKAYVPNRFGACFPDSCSETEVETLASNFTEKYLGWKNTLENAECFDGETEVTAATVCCAVVLSLIGAMMVVGTFYDVVYIQNLVHFLSKTPEDTVDTDTNKSLESIAIDLQTKPKDYKTLSDNNNPITTTNSSNNNGNKQKLKTMEKVLKAFSVYTNSKSLLHVNHSADSIGCLHGLRYLSIIWVIFGHTYYFGIRYSINQENLQVDYSDSLRYVPAGNSFLAVDTFFTLSGLLTSYLSLKTMEKKGWNLNWPMFYFHRFWRLTPPYMLVILTSLGLTQYFGEGAMWSSSQPIDKEYCEEDWWRNLLYINNFGDPNKMCVYHAWYLANDMQFFVLSPLLFLPFYFSQAAGFVVCLIVLIASWTTTGVLSTINEWHPTQIERYGKLSVRLEWEEDFYVKPWCRIGPFVVGVVAGFILSITKGKSLKLKSWVVTLGWLVMIATGLAALFGIYGDISQKHPSSVSVAALYNAVSHSVWGLVISWIILACDSGYGGPINAFLSWSPFVVLSRLTYMTYLLHPYIMYIYLQNQNIPFYSNDATMGMYFIGFSFFSTFAAFFFSLAFESPMVGLEKVLLQKSK